MKEASKIIKNIPKIIGVALILFLLSGIRMNDFGQYTFFGYEPVVIVSGSMLPTIQINSLTIVRECSIEDIEVDDIIMYYHPSMKINITHRVIEKNTREDGSIYLVTQGDNNNVRDNIQINSNLLRGKMVRIYNQFVPIINLAVRNEQLNTGLLSLVLIIVVLAALNVIDMLMDVVSYILAFLTAAGILKKRNIRFRENARKLEDFYREVSSDPSNYTIEKEDGFGEIFEKVSITQRFTGRADDIDDALEFIHKKNSTHHKS